MDKRESTTTSEPDYDFADQLSDLWSIVRRHLGLVIVSLILSLGLGALYYLKAPRTYESTVEISIFNKLYSSGFGSGEHEEQPLMERTIETHALTIGSPRIVKRAVAEYDLGKLPTLREEENPAQFILDNLSVKVKEENASVLLVSYLGSSDSDCQKVAHAIGATYEDYIEESNQGVSAETVQVIENAHKDLTAQLHKIDTDLDRVHEAAPEPLYWKDENPVNRYHERQQIIEASRQEIMVERSVLQAKTDALAAALDQGGISRDAVYYQALKELQPEDKNIEYWQRRLENEEQRVSQEAVREYAALLTGEFVKLMVKEREMRDEFGDGHPDLDSVVRSKETVRTMLRKTLENEQPLVDTVLEKTVEEEEKDYVAIYMQMLMDQMAVLDRQIEKLDGDYDKAQKNANMMQGYLAREKTLRDEKSRLESMYASLTSQLDDIKMIKSNSGERIEILAEAEVGQQVAPHLLRVGVASMFLGCFAGCLLAYAVDRAENTFRSAHEIRQMLRVPVVGRVPLIKRGQQTKLAAYPAISPMVCTVHQEGSHLSEAFRGVRTSLYFSTAGHSHKIIQVTSPSPGDGKSTMTANLAVTIAKSGKSVLVIDADFRRPSMHKLFGRPGDTVPGLAEVMSGDVHPCEAAVKTEIDNLYFMGTGERPHNPSELLSSSEFKASLEILREKFDFVLVDTPPLLAVTDPCAVAARVDGVLMVLKLRKGVLAAALRAKEMLTSLEANILGVIVNGVDEKRGYSGGGYGHGYGLYSEDYIDKPQRSKKSPVLVKNP